MYKCRECEETFYTPKQYTEHIGDFWGGAVYETFYMCPYCDSEDYDKEDIVDREFAEMESEECEE